VVVGGEFDGIQSQSAGVHVLVPTSLNHLGPSCRPAHQQHQHQQPTTRHSPNQVDLEDVYFGSAQDLGLERPIEEMGLGCVGWQIRGM